MKPTPEMIEAIVNDASYKLQSIIYDPIDDDSDIDQYEDEYGNCYPSGSCFREIEVFGICSDGLPGLKEGEISISAAVDVEAYFHNDYDPGDYWTPPSGGWECTDCEAYMRDMEFDVSCYNPDTDEYEEVEFDEATIQHILSEIHGNVTQYPRVKKSAKKAI